MKYLSSFLAILTHPFPIPLFLVLPEYEAIMNVCDIHSFVLPGCQWQLGELFSPDVAGSLNILTAIRELLSYLMEAP